MNFRLKILNLKLAILLGVALWISVVQCPDNPLVDNNPALDTTSHTIFWEVDTLISIGTSSQINDVAVVNDSTIWAVGDFFQGVLTTPSGDQRNKSHIVKLNGSCWSYDWIYYDGIYYAHELYDILFFSNSNQWILDGNIWHWNGEKWKLYQLWDMGLINEDKGGIRALWGPNPDNVYFVGLDGVILHWNGSSLNRMISNTTADLRSIAGIKGIVWACGKDYITHERVLLEYRDGIWQKKELPGGWAPTTGDFLSVGAYGDSLYMAGWSCLLIESAKNPNKHRMIHFSHMDSSYIAGVTNYYFNYMLVLGYNDIFFSCKFGRIYHYNGRSLYRYPIELDGWMTGIDGKDDFIVAIGYDMQTAYVFRGYR